MCRKDWGKSGLAASLLQGLARIFGRSRSLTVRFLSPVLPGTDTSYRRAVRCADNPARACPVPEPERVRAQGVGRLRQVDSVAAQQIDGVEGYLDGDVATIV
jgi:hypothetical protein